MRAAADPLIQSRPSPNCGDRREGALPDLIVLHYTAMATPEAALDRLCDPSAEVSAHYLIDPQGDIHQLVDETARAWHAGAGSWGKVTDVNSRSIGIEIANTGQTPFSAAAMQALEDLLPGIMDRWQMSPERVIGHSDMAPSRKSDPGPRFDWRRLALAGLSVWPSALSDPKAADLSDFAEQAAHFGYTASTDPSLILSAFRLRFRPGVSGPLDPTDVMLIADLARRFPVDADPATT